MKFELTNNKIDVIPGVIKVERLEELKGQAEVIKHSLEYVVVTEENLKESKKTVADLRKAKEKLENDRKLVKKKYMQVYQDFELQVKDIVNIIDEADDIVRSQVRDLERKERDAKKVEIEEVFNKHLLQYDFNSFVRFEHFFKEQLLNKTMTMKKVEAEIVKFLNDADDDYKVILSLPNSEIILRHYTKCFNLTEAIQRATEEIKEKELIEEKLKEVDEIEEAEKTYKFMVTGEKDYNLIKLLMKDNNIKYVEL